MPQIFDNIEQSLLPTLCEAMGLSERADFCVGYFNLRGWRQIDSLVEKWAGGDGHCCRLLVGMQQMPRDQLRSNLSVLHRDEPIDNKAAIALEKQLTADYAGQPPYGIQTNATEAGLSRMAARSTAR